MRIQDIKVGEWYKIKNTNGYGWVQVLEIYKKGQYNSPDKSKSLIKCHHVVNKNDSVGFVRYFRPMDLIKPIK